MFTIVNLKSRFTLKFFRKYIYFVAKVGVCIVFNYNDLKHYLTQFTTHFIVELFVCRIYDLPQNQDTVKRINKLNCDSFEVSNLSAVIL